MCLAKFWSRPESTRFPPDDVVNRPPCRCTCTKHPSTYLHQYNLEPISPPFSSKPSLNRGGGVIDSSPKDDNCPATIIQIRIIRGSGRAGVTPARRYFKAFPLQYRLKPCKIFRLRRAIFPFPVYRIQDTPKFSACGGLISLCINGY